MPLADAPLGSRWMALFLREGTSWPSSLRHFVPSHPGPCLQLSPYSGHQGGPQAARLCAGRRFSHAAGASPSWPPTSPCQAASYGCFKTFSIKCIVGRVWSCVAGNVPVPTSTLDGVLSHVPAAVPAKLLWAILERIQKCLGSPLSHPGRPSTSHCQS